MAKPKSDIPLEKIALNLGKGDFAMMGQLFPSMGGGKAIRLLVRNYITQIRRQTKPLEIDINPDDVKELLADDRESAPTNPTA